MKRRVKHNAKLASSILKLAMETLINNALNKMSGGGGGGGLPRVLFVWSGGQVPSLLEATVGRFRERAAKVNVENLKRLHMSYGEERDQHDDDDYSSSFDFIFLNLLTYKQQENKVVDQSINQLCLKLLKPNGLLCSFHHHTQQQQQQQVPSNATFLV